MHRFVRVAATGLVAFALCAAAPRAFAATADDVANLLPETPVTAEVLTPDYSPQMQAISRRIMNAAQADPKWFQSWVAQHPRGALPWHPKLGVTKPEYDLYMREGRAAHFAVRTRVRLTFEKGAGGRRWTIRGWGVLDPIDGLVLDLDGNRAVSPRWGVLAFLGSAAPTDPGVQLPWRWYAVWKATHQVGDATKGGQVLAASLHVGPLGDGRTLGLYWVARRLNGGRKLDDEFLLLRFPARTR